LWIMVAVQHVQYLDVDAARAPALDEHLRVDGACEASTSTLRNG